MNRTIERMNAIPVKSLERIADSASNTRFLIEGGRITGYMHGDNGKLHKEIPTQTANPSGDLIAE